METTPKTIHFVISSVDLYQCLLGNSLDFKTLEDEEITVLFLHFTGKIYNSGDAVCYDYDGIVSIKDQIHHFKNGVILTTDEGENFVCAFPLEN